MDEGNLHRDDEIKLLALKELVDKLDEQKNTFQERSTVFLGLGVRLECWRCCWREHISKVLLNFQKSDSLS